MSPDDMWWIAWLLSGLPFAAVCTAQFWRTDHSWLGLLPGVSIGAVFGPFSLLLIGRDQDDEDADEVAAST